MNLTDEVIHCLKKEFKNDYELKVLNYGKYDYFTKIEKCNEILYKLTQSTLFECEKILMNDVCIYTLNTAILCMIYGRNCDYDLQNPLRYKCVHKWSHVLQRTACGALARSEEDRYENVQYLIGKNYFRYWIALTLWRFGLYPYDRFSEFQKYSYSKFLKKNKPDKNKMCFSESDEREYMKATLPPDRFRKYEECMAKIKNKEQMLLMACVQLRIWSTENE
ncbi:MAG: hypothetical protein LIO94_11485, partial [Clostridiales bacterium]|nr:hypothetical protein [Clostridiales bacterium]